MGYTTETRTNTNHLRAPTLVGSARDPQARTPSELHPPRLGARARIRGITLSQPRLPAHLLGTLDQSPQIRSHATTGALRRTWRRTPLQMGQFATPPCIAATLRQPVRLARSASTALCVEMFSKLASGILTANTQKTGILLEDNDEGKCPQTAILTRPWDRRYI